MRRLFTFFLVLLMTSPATTPKAAEKSEVRAVFETTGGFGFCAIAVPQKDGRKISLARTAGEDINLALTIPGGGFIKERRYDLDVALDQNPARRVRALATNENALLLEMGHESVFLRELEKSKQLSTTAGATTLSFLLPPMKQTMADLADCVQINKGRTTAPTDDLALPESLKALLKRAGFQNIKPIGMEKIPEAERPADFAWTNGPVLGGVRERLIPEDETLSSLLALHLEGLKSKCGGGFKTTVERAKTFKTIHLQKAEVLCERKKGSETLGVHVAILFYSPDLKRFTVFTHEAMDEHKKEAFAARNKLAETLGEITKP